MEYVGIQTQQSSNNRKVVALLCLFPCLVLGLTYLFFFILFHADSESANSISFETVNHYFIGCAPFVLGLVLLWFVIAYFWNTSIINRATGAKPLDRKENKRVYNLVENLCISKGMRMPKVNIINDNSLNAYASGINEKSYAVTLTKGIIEKLDDDELEGVIAHELTHIRNKDVRLLIVSIVFVGIFTMIAQISLRMIYHVAMSSSTKRSNNKDKGGGAGALLLVLFLVAVLAAVGYLFATLMRFAISRKREYMADAGASEMTRNPQALASALRKISGDPVIASVTRSDVAQLFIEHPKEKSKYKFISAVSGLFATHPPIEKRIEVLEQF